MKKTIELLTPSYEKGLKTILKQYESFCVKHQLEEVDLELERNDDIIEATWVIYAAEADTVHEVYQNYQLFASSCEEEVELVDVSLEEGSYFVQYEVKQTYVLSP